MKETLIEVPECSGMADTMAGPPLAFSLPIPDELLGMGNGLMVGATLKEAMNN